MHIFTVFDIKNFGRYYFRLCAAYYIFHQFSQANIQEQTVKMYEMGERKKL